MTHQQQQPQPETPLPQMFYSQQLLAPKTQLGQIWRAANNQRTKRKLLDKIDIIKICEEILSPSVPMALRLSSILMNGLLKVYKWKVDLLYDDLLKHKAAFKVVIRAMKGRPAVLPKGKKKGQAKPVLFKHTGRFRGMCLDDLDEQYVNAEHHHQPGADNITLVDNFVPGPYETYIFNRFERFEVPDHDSAFNITPDGHPEAPRPEDPPQQQEQCAAPSPIREEPQQQEQCAAPSPIREEPEQGDSLKEQEEQRTKEYQPARPGKRKARDECFERFEVPDHDSAFNITSDGHPEAPRPEDPPQQQEQCAAPSPIREEPQQQEQCAAPSPIHEEPEQGDSLKEQEEQRTKEYQPARPGKRKARGECPQGEVVMDDQVFIPGKIYKSWLDDESSFTAKRPLVNSNIIPIKEIKIAELLHLPLLGLVHCSDDSQEVPYPHQLMRNRISLYAASTSGGSGRGPSGQSSGNLDPVEEEFPMEQQGRGVKRTRLSDIGPIPGSPFPSPPPDHISESTLNSRLKLHLESPDASESLNNLTDGMNTAQAARLFYQTCVLATQDRIKVTQVEPYGSIQISRGATM